MPAFSRTQPARSPPRSPSGRRGGRRPAPAPGGNSAHQALIAVRDHAVLAAALDPILTFDGLGMVLSASDSVERLFGWSSQELLGQNLSLLMPEPQRTAQERRLQRRRLTGFASIAGGTCEIEGLRRDGGRVTVELSVAPVAAPRGEPPVFVAVLRDISQRKRMERELRLVQDLALSISSASKLSEARTDTIRRICLATGWDYGELWAPEPGADRLAGTACWMRHDCGLETFAESMRCCTLHPTQGLPGRVWSSSQSFWVGDLNTLTEAEFCRLEAARAAGLKAVAGVPILSDERPLAALLFFVRQTRREDPALLDLVRAAVAPLGTLIKRKRAEAELEEYRQRLEEKVRDRTEALHASQEKLRFTDRLASIGTLAAGLGHDMSNVLLPVRAHLNAMRANQASGLSTAARGHVEAIRKSVAYLQQLADGLHYLAADPEKDTAAAEALDLGEWWARCGALITKAVPKHVRVKAAFPARLPPVNVAAAGLTQALLNLVVNAGEAISREDGRAPGLVCVAACRAATMRSVRLSVTDNGAGMSEEVRRRAFEMFFTTKPRGLGTGLGLPLVRKVVVEAGGTIEIDSHPGKGTTVTMILPVGGAAPAGRRQGQEQLRALISLDETRPAALVRQLLEAAGVRVSEGGEPADHAIWVVAPRSRRLPQAKRWLTRRPEGRLILWEASARDVPDGWKLLRPIFVDKVDDLGLVRSRIGLALGRQQFGSARHG